MPRKTWRAALATYAHPAALALLLLGFAAGLPYMLVFSTLSVWLREAGVTHQTIGYASLIGLAYAFKWVWAPMLDQWRLPLLGRLGRRRSWLVLSQGLVALGLIGMALCDPQQHLSWLIGVAVVVAFASATQDIAVDAYRLEIVDDTRQAALAASYMAGYRVAALLATAGALYFAGWFGTPGAGYQHGAWASTYLLFAMLMLPGLITTLWMREPPVPMRTQIAAARYGLYRQLASVLVLIVLLVSMPAMFTQFFRSDVFLMLSGEISFAELAREDRAFMRFGLYAILTAVCLSRMGRRGLAPVLTPVNDFILRYRWQALLLLGLIATYRMSDTVMGVMANVFYIDMGFAKSQIASVSKLFGLIMTLLGAALGGLLIVRFGILPILLLGGVASAGTNLLFATLSGFGAVTQPALYAEQTVSHLLWALDPHMLMLVVTIALDNLSSGLATAAFVAYLSSLTNLQFSATQYALLSSIMLLLPRLVGGYSGVMVENAGYAQFFIATALLGVPTLILIVVQWSRQGRQPLPAPEPAAAVPRSEP